LPRSFSSFTNSDNDLCSRSTALEQFSAPVQNSKLTTGSHDKWLLLLASREHWDPNALEPVASNGYSPLFEFVEREKGVFHCIVPMKIGTCDYSNVKKGRMLSHIRKEHLNFRPFPCGPPIRSFDLPYLLVPLGSPV